jgi:hypothetical protein
MKSRAVSRSIFWSSFKVIAMLKPLQIYLVIPTIYLVIPAQAGIQPLRRKFSCQELGPRLRGGDGCC